jgi:hypothetical protein
MVDFEYDTYFNKLRNILPNDKIKDIDEILDPDRMLIAKLSNCYFDDNDKIGIDIIKILKN